MTVVAKVYGAVSIVNAIATGKGCTLGIDTFVETTLTKKQGTGIHITSENKTISSRLINKVIENIISKKVLENTRLELDFRSKTKPFNLQVSIKLPVENTYWKFRKAFDSLISTIELLKLSEYVVFNFRLACKSIIIVLPFTFIDGLGSISGKKLICDLFLI